MRITGYKIGTGYYIDASLILHVPMLVYTVVYRTLVYKIRFTPDVSKRVQTTTISIKDSVRFYNVIPSPTVFTSTLAGNIPTSIIYNCGLAFCLGQSAHVELLPQINILNPPPPIPYWKNNASMFYSSKGPTSGR